MKPINKELKKEKIEQLKFVPSGDICPSSSLYKGYQSYESKAESKITTQEKDGVDIRIKDAKGYCLAWSWWYAYLRLKFPKISNEELKERSFKILSKDPEKLRQFIRGQMRFMYDLYVKYIPAETLKIYYKNGSKYMYRKHRNLYDEMIRIIDDEYKKRFEKATQ